MNVRILRNSEASPGRHRDRIAARPAMDLVEDGAGLALHCDVPGVSAERLHLHLRDGVLHLFGETGFGPSQEGRIHALEFDDMVYEATFPLPEALRDSSMEASLRNGVLTVRFTPRPKSGRRSIPVNKD